MKKIIKVENPPYIVIGHSAIPQPKLKIVFKVSGLRKIIEDLDDEDSVCYVAWSDVTDRLKTEKHYSEWSVLKND